MVIGPNNGFFAPNITFSCSTSIENRKSDSRAFVAGIRICFMFFFVGIRLPAILAGICESIVNFLASAKWCFAFTGSDEPEGISGHASLSVGLCCLVSVFLSYLRLSSCLWCTWPTHTVPLVSGHTTDFVIDSRDVVLKEDFSASRHFSFVCLWSGRVSHYLVLLWHRATSHAGSVDPADNLRVQVKFGPRQFFP